MAYGSSSSISYLGAQATGAMASGSGFRQATGSLIDKIHVVAGGLIPSVKNIKQHTNQPNESELNVFGAGDAHGSGAFTGTVSSFYAGSRVGTGFGMDRLSAHASLMFGSSPIQMAQTFYAAQGFVSNSKTLAPVLQKLRDGIYFGKFPNLDSLTYPSDGVFPTYLGSAIPDYQAVVTNGISTLVRPATKANFELLARDLVNLGSAYDMTDMSTFGNPGQVVRAVQRASGMTSTGLDTVLASVRIDPDAIFDLGDESYNVIMQAVLEAVNVSELVENAQTLLGSNLDIDNLGGYTDFDKIFVNSKAVLTFKNMDQFKEKVQALELGRIETVAEFAAYINTIEPATLPNIGTGSDFVNPAYINEMVATFLGGTGEYDAVTMEDMIGILGAVGITDAAANYRTAMTALHNAGVFSTLKTQISQWHSTLTLAPTGPDGDGDYTITDGTITGEGGSISATYADYQTNKIAQINGSLAAIYALRTTNTNVNLAINSWRSIMKKINDEKEFQTRVDMNYGIRTNFKDNAFTFVRGLRGTINNDAKKAIIVGMIDEAILLGDTGAEYMRAYVAELENKLRADDFDVRWRAELDE